MSGEQESARYTLGGLALAVLATLLLLSGAPAAAIPVCAAGLGLLGMSLAVGIDAVIEVRFR